jgi:hypothetical protein
MRPSAESRGSAEKIIAAERKLFCYARVKEYRSKSKKNIRAGKKIFTAFRRKLCGKKCDRRIFQSTRRLPEV